MRYIVSIVRIRVLRQFASLLLWIASHPTYALVGPTLASCLCEPVASIGFGPQLGSSQAVELASQICARVGIKFQATTASAQETAGPLQPRAQNSVCWIVRSAGTTVYLDGSGALMGLRNEQRTKALRQHGAEIKTPLLGTPQACWRTAVSYLSKLGLDTSNLYHEELHDRSRDLTGNPDARGRVQLVFAPKPFGYDARNFGNSIGVELDARDGGLVSLIRSTGWTYDRPGKIIPISLAAQKARSVIEHDSAYYPGRMKNKLLRDVSDTSVLARSAKLLYADSNGLWGSTEGLKLLRSRHLRLLYEFTTPSMIINIDATTGDCLGGAVRDGGVDRRIRGLGH